MGRNGVQRNVTQRNGKVTQYNVTQHITSNLLDMNLFHHSERLFSGHLNINKNIDILRYFDILI